MSIRSQAAADLQSILNQDGEDITLTAPGPVVYNVKGQVTRIDVGIDPDTGTQFFEPKTAVTVSLSDLSADPTTEWAIETTDVTGQTITGQVIEVRFDRTLGFVTMLIEVVN